MIYDLRLTHIFREVRFRFLWCFFSYGFTFCFSYHFSEELLYLLAKPFLQLFQSSPLTLEAACNCFFAESYDVEGPSPSVAAPVSQCLTGAPKVAWPPTSAPTSPHFSSFISTQLTEALNTYITSSCIFSFVFCIPFFFYQIWCFLIPSCNQTQRQQVARYILLSLTFFVCFFSISLLFLLPNVWLFLYSLSKTSTKLFVIQLQPKIYDFIMLTIRFMFLSFMGSQIPVILLWLVELKKILLQDCIKYRSSLVLCSILLSALLTPPDFICQLLTSLFILVVVELTLFYAFVKVHYTLKIQ
jgi:Tat protein translocase TatC